MNSIQRFRLTMVAMTLTCFMLTAVVSQQKEPTKAPANSPAAKPADDSDASESEEKKGEDIRDLKLRDWHPKTMVKVKQSHINRAAFPVIDVHNHLGGREPAKTLTEERIKKYLDAMNDTGVSTVVNLDRRLGREPEVIARSTGQRLSGPFFDVCALIDFRGIDDIDWTDREVKRLRAGFEAGAKGLKIHKSLGLTYRYKNGELMKVDDPKIRPLWDLCAEYNKPVMIHVSDPAAFFTPLDGNNERWHELNKNPQWLFYGDKYPSNEEIHKQFISMISKHPKTTFIGARRLQRGRL